MGREINFEKTRNTKIAFRVKSSSHHEYFCLSRTKSYSSRDINKQFMGCEYPWSAVVFPQYVFVLLYFFEDIWNFWNETKHINSSIIQNFVWYLTFNTISSAHTIHPVLGRKFHQNYWKGTVRRIYDFVVGLLPSQTEISSLAYRKNNCIVDKTTIIIERLYLLCVLQNQFHDSAIKESHKVNLKMWKLLRSNKPTELMVSFSLSITRFLIFGDANHWGALWLSPTRFYYLTESENQYKISIFTIKIIYCLV